MSALTNEIPLISAIAQKMRWWNTRANMWGNSTGRCPHCDSQAKVATGLIGLHNDPRTGRTCEGFYQEAAGKTSRR